MNTHDQIQHDTDRFQCESCGSNMVFSPEDQAMVCQHCGAKKTMNENPRPITEHAFDENIKLASEDWGGTERVIICSACGGQTILAEKEISTSCVFCGSPHVVKSETGTGLKPESLIPFKISYPKAMEAFNKWLRTKIFAPKKLKHFAESDKLKGVYVPSWTYDTDTSSMYKAKCGTKYYEYENVESIVNGKKVVKREKVEKIRWEEVGGGYTMALDDVFINASKSFDQNIMNGLEPFNFNELLPYRPDFLSGFAAEKYAVDVKEGWIKAQGSIKTILENSIRNMLYKKYDIVSDIRLQTQYKNITFKHLLVPVWVSSFRFKEKIYRFMVNGQSGRVRGKAPVSPFKVAAAIVLAIAVLVLLYYLFSIL